MCIDNSIVPKGSGVNYLKEKWNSFNKKIISRYTIEKEQNHQFNENVFIELVDKVRVKKNELDHIKNLMNHKINKIQRIYKKKRESLDYKRRNFIISDQIYESDKRKIDQYYLNKINTLKRKKLIKNRKFQKDFDNYKINIKGQSVFLKKENEIQELHFNKKNDFKIELNKSKYKKSLKKNHSYFNKISKYYNDYENKSNAEYVKFENKLKLELKNKKIGKELFYKMIADYEKKITKKYETNLRIHEIFNVPFNYQIDRIKSNSKTFGNYLNFKKNDNKLFQFLNANKLIIAIIVLSLIVGFINPLFFSASNWFNNIMGNTVYFGLLATGTTFVILIGGIDLSIGSGLAFSGSIMLILASHGLNIYVAILVGVITSMLISLLMGIIVAYGKFQAFIVTLVGLLVLGGITKVVLDGTPISINDPFINWLGSSINGIFPIVLFIFLIVLVIAYVVLKWTTYGRKIYATGSNSDAARVSGINIKWIVASTFLISGFTVGLAAIVFAAQIKSISPTTGVGFELDAIAAVVLGGASLSGGKGSIIKTAVGWLVISMLGNIFIF